MLAKVVVEASREEVMAVLATGLTARELDAIEITAATSDPFAPEPHRDLPSFQTVIEFVAASVASGITYDVLKKAAMVLGDKLGRNKVRKIGSESDTPPVTPPASKRDDVDGDR